MDHLCELPEIIWTHGEPCTFPHFQSYGLCHFNKNIIPFGPFSYCILEFPELGFSITVDSGDIFYHGAHLKHKCQFGRMQWSYDDRSDIFFHGRIQLTLASVQQGLEKKNFHNHFPVMPLSKFVYLFYPL